MRASIFWSRAAAASVDSTPEFFVEDRLHVDPVCSIRAGQAAAAPPALRVAAHRGNSREWRPRLFPDRRAVTRQRDQPAAPLRHAAATARGAASAAALAAAAGRQFADETEHPAAGLAAAAAALESAADTAQRRAQ